MHYLVIIGHELVLPYLRAGFSTQKAADLHSFWWHHASLHSLQHQPQWGLCFNKDSSAAHWDATLKVPEPYETCLAPSEPWKTLTAMKAPTHFKSLLSVTDFHLLALCVAITKYCHLCNQICHAASSEAAKAICSARHTFTMILNIATLNIHKLLRSKRKVSVWKKSHWKIRIGQYFSG